MSVARVGPARLSGGMQSWNRIRAISRRQAYVLQRSGHRLFDVTLWPLVDTLLFGSLAFFFAGQSGHSKAGQAAAAYLLSGIILWHVVYQAQIAVATGLLEETWSRNLLSVMVTPIREIEFVAGVALFGLAKLVAGVAVVAVTAFAFYAFNVTTLGIALLPVILILLIAGWAVAMFVMGLILRFGDGAEALAWGIMFVIMPLSGVFYPVKALPAFLRPISYLLPTTHAFSVARALVDGRVMPWGELGLAAITTLLVSAAAVWFLLHMLKLFRRRGYITRYS